MAIAVRYALQPAQLAIAIADNTIHTQVDDTVVSMTVAFGAVLGLLVQGHKLDTDISNKLMKLVKSRELPFHRITSDNLQSPRKENIDLQHAGYFTSTDALLSPIIWLLLR